MGPSPDSPVAPMSWPDAASSATSGFGTARVLELRWDYGVISDSALVAA